ncbi:IS110 family transposase [Salinarimonas rosea]|uniref:IS110 family transposase n=1 Tax=Salinarimonas rosea TaxID=552063 RepID=UPI0004194F1D|nr:IS110 family transposase [Salinarimonas rosea]
MRICVGIDVAKDVHWVHAVDQDARVLIDRAVSNEQEALEALASDLVGLDGEVRVGLDVTGSIACFLEAVLIAAGLALVHVPGIAVNRAAQGHAGGERKSDPRDARVIADLVRTRADLRPILPDEETTVAIRLLVSRRGDLVQDQTRRVSRLRQFLASIHPGLERSLDLGAKGPLVLLTRFVTPGEIRAAGNARIVKQLRKTPSLRDPERLAEIALSAARAQTIVVPGEATLARLVRELAVEALAARERIAEIDKELAALVAAHPDGALIRSLPGMGVVLSAEFIAAAGSIARFRSADAMASAAGLAPILRQSGKARALRRAFGGDKALKRVFYQSAFCAVVAKDPTSRAYYDRKRREGHRHVQALVALARRRVNVLWAILNHRQPFDPSYRAA